MAALVYVQDYLDQARVLLQDTEEPYRYSDQELVDALNMAIMDTRRLRPDLMKAYFNATTGVPSHTTTSMSSTAVDIDQMYRVAFVYYICGNASMRDDENNEDQRSAAFMARYSAQLLTTQA